MNYGKSLEQVWAWRKSFSEKLGKNFMSVAEEIRTNMER